MDEDVEGEETQFRWYIYIYICRVSPNIEHPLSLSLSGWRDSKQKKNEAHLSLFLFFLSLFFSPLFHNNVMRNLVCLCFLEVDMFVQMPFLEFSKRYDAFQNVPAQKNKPHF